MAAISIEYNLAQYVFLQCEQKFKIMEWGRGTGKSTILSKQIVDCVYEMPRSTGVLVAETFAQIKTRTLPSTISGLEQHGFYKGIHYLVGEKPPASWNWPEAYEPPLDYKNCVYFYNGTVMLFVSQDGSASSGRGLNVDWVVGDEATRLDEEKFETDILLTNRGGLTKIAHYPDGTWQYFKDCKNHHSVTLASSTPVTASGQWFLKYEELAAMDPTKYVFLRASAEVNRHNLGEEYFENARKIMPDFLYDAEVRNIRIKTIKDGFYPKLKEELHCYNNFNHNFYEELKSDVTPNSLGDADCNPDIPLIAGIDWGGNINCMVVCQDHGEEFRFLKNHYVKYPRIIDDLIKEEFCQYYKHHNNKTLYLWYDPSGNVKVANSRMTYAEQVKKILVEQGWDVRLMTKHGYNELHERKYRLWIDLLQEEDPRYPKIRFNKSNCRELWISMTTAPATRGRTEAIKKDKRSEKNKKMDQAHATHLSDTADVVVVGMFLHTQLNQHTVPEPRIR